LIQQQERHPACKNLLQQSKDVLSEAARVTSINAGQIRQSDINEMCGSCTHFKPLKSKIQEQQLHVIYLQLHYPRKLIMITEILAISSSNKL